MCLFELNVLWVYFPSWFLDFVSGFLEHLGACIELHSLYVTRLFLLLGNIRIFILTSAALVPKIVVCFSRIVHVHLLVAFAFKHAPSWIM